MALRTLQRRTRQLIRECYFCKNAVEDIDYKDIGLLKRYISSYGKIAPRKRSGCCAKHQRKLAHAIKKARIMALLPFAIQ
ncbi:30S ribosomal protein S18 [Candidatus Uhrbacteria bacterium]|nr:30S ribosomal protein S18 [Candidatus Uhrbacteria bacterium]